LEDSLGKICKN